MTNPEPDAAQAAKATAHYRLATRIIFDWMGDPDGATPQSLYRALDAAGLFTAATHPLADEEAPVAGQHHRTNPRTELIGSVAVGATITLVILGCGGWLASAMSGWPSAVAWVLVAVMALVFGGGTLYGLVTNRGQLRRGR